MEITGNRVRVKARLAEEKRKRYDIVTLSTVLGS